MNKLITELVFDASKITIFSQEPTTEPTQMLRSEAPGHRDGHKNR